MRRKIWLPVSAVLVAAGWVCVALGLREHVESNHNVEPMPTLSTEVTPLAVAGYCLMAAGLLVLGGAVVVWLFRTARNRSSADPDVDSGVGGMDNPYGFNWHE